MKLALKAFGIISGILLLISSFVSFFDPEIGFFTSIIMTTLSCLILYASLPVKFKNRLKLNGKSGDNKLVKEKSVLDGYRQIVSSVSGLRYHDFTKKELKKAWSYEVPVFLDLVPEPENEYDGNAIQIKWEEYLLGYVQKEYAEDVSEAIQMGMPVSCIILYYLESGKIDERLTVKILIKKDDENTN